MKIASGNHQYANQTIAQSDKDTAFEHSGGSATIDNCTISAGAAYRGQGASSVRITRLTSGGHGSKNPIILASDVASVKINNHGLDVCLTNDKAEVIRLRRVTHAACMNLVIGAKVAIVDESGREHIWSRCCVFGKVTIGGGKEKLELSRWINCEFDEEPEILDGAVRVEFVDCTVAGKTFEKTVQGE